jgi:hypothetical protein
LLAGNIGLTRPRRKHISAGKGPLFTGKGPFLD